MDCITEQIVTVEPVVEYYDVYYRVIELLLDDIRDLKFDISLYQPFLCLYSLPYLFQV